jgi:hypothetical protein
MYIIIQWKNGWVLHSTGYANEQEARNYIRTHCLHTRECASNYRVAHVLENG